MKKQSHLQNEIERLEKLVQHHEENGWFGTVFHEELARLKAVQAGGKPVEELSTGKGSATDKGSTKDELNKETK